MAFVEAAYSGPGIGKVLEIAARIQHVTNLGDIYSRERLGRNFDKVALDNTNEVIEELLSADRLVSPTILWSRSQM